MKKAEKVIGGFSRAISGICLVAITLLITVNVAMRLLWQGGVTGSVTFSEYLLVVSSFGALAHGQYEGAHVKMGALTERLPPAARMTLSILVKLAVLAFAGTLTLSLAPVAWGDWQQRTADWAVSFYLPIWIKEVAAALGSALLFLALLTTPWEGKNK